VLLLRFLVPGAALVAIVFAAALGRQTTPGTATALGLHKTSSTQNAPRTTRAKRLGSGKQVVLAFAGDVHAEGGPGARLAAGPSEMLAPIAPVFARANIAVVNLETAVTSRGSAAAKTYTFRAPASIFGALRAGGVDVTSMANNHGLDFGEDGLRDSLAAARQYRFPLIGIGLDDRRAYAPYRVKINGQHIAILGATQVLDDHLIGAWTAGPRKPGLASAKNVPRLLREVRKARKTADTVVVFLHWGRELERCPTTDQRTLARQLVGAGADVIVGSHAHRLLGAGRMGKALVGYGLGNFVWYGSSELSTQTGVLLVTTTGRRVDGYRWVPARIVGGVPQPLEGAEQRAEIASWRSLRGCTGLKP
jgi:poly-gamma-glutamate capsule biosynthesis protein CapA/YwtB (metallophosphatase superfamily)